MMTPQMTLWHVCSHRLCVWLHLCVCAFMHLGSIRVGEYAGVCVCALASARTKAHKKRRRCAASTERALFETAVRKRCGHGQ